MAETRERTLRVIKGCAVEILGKGEQFKSFWTSEPKAPDEKDWLKLFESDLPTATLRERPILILLDEMPP